MLILSLFVHTVAHVTSIDLFWTFAVICNWNQTGAESGFVSFKVFKVILWQSFNLICMIFKTQRKANENSLFGISTADWAIKSCGPFVWETSETPYFAVYKHEILHWAKRAKKQFNRRWISSNSNGTVELLRHGPSFGAHVITGYIFTIRVSLLNILICVRNFKQYNLLIFEF